MNGGITLPKVIKRPVVASELWYVLKTIPSLAKDAMLSTRPAEHRRQERGSQAHVIGESRTGLTHSSRLRSLQLSG